MLQEYSEALHDTKIEVETHKAPVASYWRKCICMMAYNGWNNEAKRLRLASSESTRLISYAGAQGHIVVSVDTCHGHWTGEILALGRAKSMAQKLERKLERKLDAGS